MTSEIILSVGDARASSGSFLEARSRIRVGDKKVLIPVDLQQRAGLEAKRHGRSGLSL